jgi:type II secretory pathway component GspD/PulD (secretin)
MRFRFTIRDLLWLTVVVALMLGWWIDHRANTTRNAPMVKLYKFIYAPSGVVFQALSPVCARQHISIGEDKTSNSIIVSATPTVHDWIKTIISCVDVPPQKAERP